MYVTVIILTVIIWGLTHVLPQNWALGLAILLAIFAISPPWRLAPDHQPKFLGVEPLWKFERDANGRVKIEWDKWDWFFALVFVLVTYAIYKGVSPVELLKIVLGVIGKILNPA